MAMPRVRHAFTVDEYHRMGEAGVFHEDDRVELLDGQIVEMTPIGHDHAGCVNALNGLLAQLAAGRAVVSVQNPIILGQHSEPQPDLALLAPRADAYRRAHPRPDEVLLVIEVADTSLVYDRDEKLPLYAKAGIPEAWLVDLPGRAVHTCRDPGSDGYRITRTARAGETLTPVRLAGVTLRVGDILG